ncbi:MAG: hypothetical protein EA382_13655, partial [Spirochaetaceae bacterium]
DDEVEDLDIDFDEDDLDSVEVEITGEDNEFDIAGEVEDELDADADAEIELDADDMNLQLGDDVDAALEELDLQDEDIDIASLSIDDDDDEDAADLLEPEDAPESALIADDTEPEEIDFQLDDVLDLTEQTPAAEDAADDEVSGDLDELDELDSADEGGIDIDDDLPDNLDDLTLDLDALDVDSFEEISAEPVGSDEDDDTIDLSALSEDDDSALVDLDLTMLPDDEPTADLSADQMPSDDTDDDLPELEMDDDVSLSLEAGFDDVGAVEDDMFADSDTMDFDNSTLPVEPAPSGTAGQQTRAEFTSLLSNIERELASIRQEIRELKATRIAPGPLAPSADEEDDDAASGFFEDEGDDDDDTIALTGAELDNIMHTAEFTETTGESSDAEEFGIIADDQKAEDQNAPPGPVQQIMLDDAPEELDSLDISLESPDDTDDAIDELAELDIDAELADIEELSDARDTIDDEELEEETLEEEPLDLDEDIWETDLPVASAEEPEARESVDSVFDESVLPSLVQDDDGVLPENLKGELRSVLSYMDQLLESLPEDKIQEFANSEHFKVYQRLFEELGLEQ